MIRTLSSKDTDQRGALGCDALAARAPPAERPAGHKVKVKRQREGKSPYVGSFADDSAIFRGGAGEQLADAANRSDSPSAFC